eukprot:COSAG06_NODE_3403_length_5394_cov_9.380302_6_plen_147_part_01
MQDLYQARGNFLARLSPHSSCTAVTVSLRSLCCLSATCYVAVYNMPQARKRHFLSHLYIKINILPRQARDEHRENSKRGAVFSQGFARWVRECESCGLTVLRRAFPEETYEIAAAAFPELLHSAADDFEMIEIRTIDEGDGDGDGDG